MLTKGNNGWDRTYMPFHGLAVWELQYARSRACIVTFEVDYPGGYSLVDRRRVYLLVQTPSHSLLTPISLSPIEGSKYPVRQIETNDVKIVISPYVIRGLLLYSVASIWIRYLFHQVPHAISVNLWVE